MCITYYRVVASRRTKIGPRAIKGAFVGYAQNSKAYRVSDLSPNRNSRCRIYYKFYSVLRESDTPTSDNLESQQKNENVNYNKHQRDKVVNELEKKRTWVRISFLLKHLVFFLKELEFLQLILFLLCYMCMMIHEHIVKLRLLEMLQSGRKQ